MLVVLALVGAGCGSSPTKPKSAQQFRGTATRMGVVSGFVLDDESGRPIANAQISISGTAVRARADGSFDATVPAGRARVEVKNDGFIQTVREIAVGDVALNLPFKLARKEAPKMIGKGGGSFSFRDALLTVPAGAFGDGTMVSLTYLGRVRVAVTTNMPQFMDSDQTPRRVVATVDMDASAPPAAAVRVRVPVPPDAAMDSVRGYGVNDAGDWSSAIMPISVGGGFADFELTGNTRFGVAVDTRKADGRKVGYLVTETGDATTAMSAGDVLMGGNEVMTASRAAAFVDPQGSRIEVAPASRARAEVPASESGTASRVAAFAGAATLVQGGVRVLVPKGSGSLVKLSLLTPATRLEVRGTAFSVTSCAASEGFVDVLSVTEGTVDAEFAGKMGPVNAGESVTFCTQCAAGQQPMCGLPVDASELPPDSSIIEPDAAPPADAAVVLPADAGAPTPDAMMVMPDAAVVTPDAPLPPPDLPPPPPDMPPPPPDMPPPPPDMPPPPPDAAPPPEDMAPPPDMGTMTFDAAIISDDAATAPPDTAPDATAAKLSMGPTMADYGTVEINTPSPSVDFVVRNDGGSPSGDLSHTVSGEFFVESTTCAGPLAPFATCLVRVKMLPTTTGQKAGTLSVSASPGGVVSASLSGYGADAAKLGLMPSGAKFGNVPPGRTSAPITFTVKNLGGLKSGTPSFSFQLTGSPFSISQNGCTAALDSGATCQVILVFTAPANFGVASDQLTVSASPGGSAQASLEGNSTYIEVTPNPFFFGDVVAGGSNMKTQDFTVWHLGQSGSPIVSVAYMISGANALDFAISRTTCANGLDPGLSCTITVDFKPSATGMRVGSLDVAAHDFASGAAAGSDHAFLIGNGL